MKKMNFIYGSGENMMDNESQLGASGTKARNIRDQNRSLFAEGFIVPADNSIKTARKLFSDRHFSISYNQDTES